MTPRTIYLVKRIETELTSQMTRRLAAFDMTPSQFTVLSSVEDTWSDLSSAQLARRFLMTPQSMNEIIGILQRKDWIQRTTDPNHKRILRINLTAKGKDILSICNAAMDEFEQEFFDAFSPEDVSVYRQLMRRLLASQRKAVL